MPRSSEGDSARSNRTEVPWLHAFVPVAADISHVAALWAIYVAVHKGFFAREDLDLELNFAQSGAAVTQQLTGGSLDVALSVGITDPIRAIEKGAPLALVRVMGNSPPYVLIGKPGLKSITDLKGKIISVGADNDITAGTSNG